LPRVQWLRVCALLLSPWEPMFPATPSATVHNKQTRRHYVTEAATQNQSILPPIRVGGDSHNSYHRHDPPGCRIARAGGTSSHRRGAHTRRKVYSTRRRASSNGLTARPAKRMKSSPWYTQPSHPSRCPLGNWMGSTMTGCSDTTNAEWSSERGTIHGYLVVAKSGGHLPSALRQEIQWLQGVYGSAHYPECDLWHTAVCDRGGNSHSVPTWPIHYGLSPVVRLPDGPTGGRTGYRLPDRGPM